MLSCRASAPLAKSRQATRLRRVALQLFLPDQSVFQLWVRRILPDPATNQLMTERLVAHFARAFPVSDSERHDLTVRTRSHHLHRAASLAVEDRRELPDLVVARPVVDEDAAGAVSVEERRPWPVDEQRHLPSGEIDAVGLAFVDLKEQAAQSMCPHYFEKQKTDGVDYTIYVGRSLREDGIFDSLYLTILVARLVSLAVAPGGGGAD